MERFVDAPDPDEGAAEAVAEQPEEAAEGAGDAKEADATATSKTSKDKSGIQRVIQGYDMAKRWASPAWKFDWVKGFSNVLESVPSRAVVLL